MKQFLKPACAVFVLLMTVIGAVAQNVATADLHGTVKDPNGAVVAAAKVTIRDDTRNFERSVQTSSSGEYLFALLPPGSYTMTVESPGFTRMVVTGVRVTVGQNAELPVAMTVAAATTEVTVSAAAELVETQRTSVASTVDQQRIENLPINERSYLAFALTTSTVNRDNGRSIGPAPTSGLNIGGQRGRSTLVSVDGADNTDTSINASRSTLSQEAVQEFQVVTNSYAAEYGRASGGVINVVSKSGSNQLHGNVFGFLRHSSFQANNAFTPSTVKDPPFTRTQYGATLGGPIQKDRTFFFGSFEQRRRQESGFFTSDVARGLGSSVTIGAPFLPFTSTFKNLTQDQATYITNLLTTGASLGAAGVPLIQGAIGYAYLASGGGSAALTGSTPLISPGGTLTPIPAGTLIGGRFLLTGAPIPLTTNVAGDQIAFRALNNLQKIFPVSEGTTFSSLRLDHKINNMHSLTLRGAYNLSLITGIQVESQNQSLGQNDFSRTGIQRFRDWSAAAGLTSALTPTLFNEARFNFGRRAAAFQSQVGDAVASNIAGTAFFGRELFSPVKRVETRYQFTDNVSWNVGHHTFKFGGDLNYIDLKANFELNFAGLFNFGGLSAGLLNPAFVKAPGCAPGALNCAPDFTPVQQYGLGFPANFIQGFGNPVSSFNNKPLAFFLQDSWQLRPNLTLNLGVRYDYEVTPQIKPIGFTDPLTGIALSAADILAAQDALGVRQGVRRDKNNVAPRIALAWDPWNDGKTVIRAAYGLFYDHPLQAIAFNSDIADAAQQQQLVSLPGSPSPLAFLNAVQIFQGTVVPGVTPGVATSAIYQSGRQRFDDQTFPGFGPVLPFSLPVTRNFKYAYANQANFTMERQITKDLSFSVGYLFVGARNLPRPIDVNAPDNGLLVQNFRNFAGRNPVNSTEALAFSLPLASNAAFTVRIPGLVAVNNATGAVIVNPAAANFFRPNAPNYFLVAARTGGLVTPAVFNAALAGSLRTPGALTPFGSVNAQSSTGTSNYHAMNVEVKKRFSQNFQFLGSYTWSHSIDDSSDLQTLLLPQDNRDLRAERADSLFDQRQRFVFSGVVTSPEAWGKGNGFKKILSNMTVAPIVEVSSGRPFNILTGIDTNNDQSSQTDRPSVLPDGTLVRPPDFDPVTGAFPAGNLGRNKGILPRFAQVDLRISRIFPINERFKLNVIGEGFNLFNKVNVAAVSPFFDDVNAFGRRDGDKYRGRPTAAFDPRQFQFGLKLNW